MSVVETSTFRLAGGADEQAFLQADRRVQTELVPNQPGFLRRTTARRGPEWLVVVLWATPGDATAFDDDSQGDPALVAFERHLEPGSLVRLRYETLD